MVDLAFTHSNQNPVVLAKGGNTVARDIATGEGAPVRVRVRYQIGEITMFNQEMKLGAVLLVGLALAACQTTTTVEETPATADLGEVAQVIHPVGTVIEYQNQDGDTQRTVLLSRADGVENWTNETTGCSWWIAESFTPAARWENCGGGSGTYDITQEGAIWPLAMQSTVRFDLKGANSKGNTWTRNHRCTVEAASNVTVPSGSYDAYKVVCADERTVRTSYYAPGVGTVAYSRVNIGSGLAEERKHIATILPPSS
ncbi:MAG: hypothetical protein QNJ84_05165 [Alphaproteobacteria bacterium]|nr:hypothetical protein [Alphaproteobacteria bacterium]